MKKLNKYAREVRERALRMVREHRVEHTSQWAAIGSIAAQIGCMAQTLCNCVRQSKRDAGECAGLSTTERDRLKVLERENRGQRDPAYGVGIFRAAELDRRFKP